MPIILCPISPLVEAGIMMPTARSVFHTAQVLQLHRKRFVIIAMKRRRGGSAPYNDAEPFPIAVDTSSKYSNILI